MPNFAIHSLPVLVDNYIHIVHVDDIHTIVVDPAVAGPVKKILNKMSRNLTHIFITHHHGDHIGGVEELKAAYPNCHIVGYKGDSHRLPPLTYEMSEGGQVTVGNITFDIWHLPGHTTGHIAFVSKSHKILFSGDVVFGMGCGRVFEGTYDEMYHSLQRIKSLDPQTKIYCTHEYTVNNGRFATAAVPENQTIKKRVLECMQLRKAGKFTVPLTLAEELQTNPFMLAMDVSQFSVYRDARNSF